MKLISHFIMFVLTTQLSKTEEKFTITVSSGAFFEEVHEAIMYEKSIPLIYTQDINNDYYENLEQTWNIQKYCDKKNNNYCDIMNQSLKLLKLINNNIRENEADMTNTYEKETSRAKRGIQILGNMVHFCCNVATEKQLKNLYTNEEMLNNQINKFKDVLASDHLDLQNITSELNKYTKNTKINIDTVKQAFQIFVKEERSNDMIEKFTHGNEIQGLQEIIFNLLTIILKFTNYERDSNTHLHCKLQKIPQRIVLPAIFYKDIKKLSNILEKDGFKLVIPLDNLSAYYNLPITECQFSKTQILIKIKIPIIEKLAKWKLYQYVPAHFKFKESVCLIFSEKTYIATNTQNNEHRMVSGIGLQHCDPPVTDLCYIPRFSADITMSPKCVEAIFKNKPLEKINQFCYFQCVKQQDEESLIIKQTGISTFTLTNPQPTLQIKQYKTNNTTIVENLDINYDHPGLIKLTLPCNYELIKNYSEIIIPKMYPCETNNINVLKLQRVIPISWTNIRSLKINHQEEQERTYFTNLTEILNEKWTEEIPNFHVSKQIKNPEKYFNELILKKIPQPFIDEFIGDIIYLSWLTILTLITIFMIYKMYPVIIKLELINLPPPMTFPPPIPPRK